MPHGELFTRARLHAYWSLPPDPPHPGGIEGTFVPMAKCMEGYHRLPSAFSKASREQAREGNGSIYGIDTGATTAIVSHGWDSSVNKKLTDELEGRQRDFAPLEKFWIEKLETEKETARNWDVFYRRHGSNFFKDRHYMDSDFEELDTSRTAGKSLSLLEANLSSKVLDNVLML